MSDTPEPVILPCGCFLSCDIVDGVKMLHFWPCHRGCHNMLKALGLADEMGLSVEYRAAP